MKILSNDTGGGVNFVPWSMKKERILSKNCRKSSTSPRDRSKNRVSRNDREKNHVFRKKTAEKTRIWSKDRKTNPKFCQRTAVKSEFCQTKQTRINIQTKKKKRKETRKKHKF